MPVPVLDASALLAHLRDEPGADVVAEAIAAGAAMSTVNLSEALTSEAARGADPVQLASELARRGLLDGAITLHPFTVEDAIEAARLRPLTRSAGLSLGDRACLALARRLGAVALTADAAWAAPKLDVAVVLLRRKGEGAAIDAISREALSDPLAKTQVDPDFAGDTQRAREQDEAITTDPSSTRP